MSVGVQRLREEPDAIRQGAIDKGEDPGLVDDGTGPRLRIVARLLGESEAPQGGAQRRVETDRRRRSRAGPPPTVRRSPA